MFAVREFTVVYAVTAWAKFREERAKTPRLVHTCGAPVAFVGKSGIATSALTTCTLPFYQPSHNCKCSMWCY